MIDGCCIGAICHAVPPPRALDHHIGLPPLCFLTQTWPRGPSLCKDCIIYTKPQDRKTCAMRSCPVLNICLCQASVSYTTVTQMISKQAWGRSAIPRHMPQDTKNKLESCTVKLRPELQTWACFTHKHLYCKKVRRLIFVQSISFIWFEAGADVWCLLGLGSAFTNIRLAKRHTWFTKYRPQALFCCHEATQYLRPWSPL